MKKFMLLFLMLVPLSGHAFEIIKTWNSATLTIKNTHGYLTVTEAIGGKSQIGYFCVAGGCQVIVAIAESCQEDATIPMLMNSSNSWASVEFICTNVREESDGIYTDLLQKGDKQPVDHALGKEPSEIAFLYVVGKRVESVRFNFKGQSTKELREYTREISLSNKGVTIK